MPDASGFPLMRRRLALAASLVFITHVRAGAQVPQPVVAPAPSQPEFLSRYDFHLTAAKLLHEDDAEQRFSWDTHFGGSVDLVDLVVGRLSLTGDYQAGLGSELRAFDPNQGNYILEAAVLGRLRSTEIGAVFHHVSRHLSDRPKRQAIAWNELAARILHQARVGDTVFDTDLDIGRVVQHSFVDYTWIGSIDLRVRHAITSRVGVFAHGFGQLVGVDEMAARRGRQYGGLAEAGVRLMGGAGVLELFAGIERRVDAYPFERVPRHWGLAGLRLLSQ